PSNRLTIAAIIRRIPAFCLALSTIPRPNHRILTIKYNATPLIVVAARELKISRETARHQLKSVFAKTDTHRQNELVALLLQVG
ncbi:MAG: helix-turn-helix transcriptional regulator, partial [Methylocella sp.]